MLPRASPCRDQWSAKNLPPERILSGSYLCPLPFLAHKSHCSTQCAPRPARLPVPRGPLVKDVDARRAGAHSNPVLSQGCLSCCINVLEKCLRQPTNPIVWVQSHSRFKRQACTSTFTTALCGCPVPGSLNTKLIPITISHGCEGGGKSRPRPRLGLCIQHCGLTLLHNLWAKNWRAP